MFFRLTYKNHPRQPGLHRARLSIGSTLPDDCLDHTFIHHGFKCAVRIFRFMVTIRLARERCRLLCGDLQIRHQFGHAVPQGFELT